MPNNETTVIKKEFTLHKLSTLLVLYLLLLAWFKEIVFVMAQHYGNVVTLVIMLIVPLIVGIKATANRQKKKTNSHDKLAVIRQLSEHQQFVLRKNAPTAQLDIVDNVLLVSLGLLYDLLSSIPFDSTKKETLFDEKFSKLTHLFKRLSHRPEFVHSTITCRSRNNAILIFAFYRLLFSDVLAWAKQHGILKDSVDRWILLKRIPPGVSMYLGAQSWRLYELTTLLEGGLEQLTLNHDIRDILSELCDEDKAETATLSDNHCEGVAKKGISKEANEKDKSSKNANSDSTAKSEKDETTEAQENSSNIDLTHPTEAVLEQAELTSQDAYDTTVLMNQFKKWLERQTSHHVINQDHRFYCDIEHYGKQLLFVSDIGLSDFAKKDRIHIESLKVALKTNGIANNAHYRLERNGDQPIELLGIPISFDVEIMHTLNGKITR